MNSDLKPTHTHLSVTVSDLHPNLRPVGGSVPILWIQMRRENFGDRKVVTKSIPIPSMGLVYLHTFTYIYHKNQPNVGKYTIHGWYGIDTLQKSSNSSRKMGKMGGLSRFMDIPAIAMSSFTRPGISCKSFLKRIHPSIHMVDGSEIQLTS